MPGRFWPISTAPSSMRQRTMQPPWFHHLILPHQVSLYYHYHRQYTSESLPLPQAVHFRKSTITTDSTLQKVYHYHRQYTSKSLPLPQAVHFRKSTITTGSTLQNVCHYHKQLHLQYTSKSIFSVTLRELFL